MPSLPFPVVFQLDRASGAQSVRVEVEPVEPDNAADYGDLVDCLCHLTNLGVFEHGGSHVGTASLETEGITDGRWSGVIRLSSESLPMWRVLLQMFVQCHYTMGALHRLVITGERRTPSGPETIATALEAPYPRARQDLPFGLRRTDAAVGTPLVSRVTLARVPSEQAIETLRKAFEDWATSVFVGGFYPPDREMNEYQHSGAVVSRLSPLVVECVVGGWNGPSVAIDALVNLFGGLHPHVALGDLEIE